VDPSKTLKNSPSGFVMGAFLKSPNGSKQFCSGMKKTSVAYEIVRTQQLTPLRRLQSRAEQTTLHQAQEDGG
jgi:hypothetical protein